MSDLKINLMKPVRPEWIDKSIIGLLGIAAGVAILVTLGIILSLLSETLNFFEKVSVFGKSFDRLTKDTVKAFLQDSKKSRFKI